MSELKHYGKGRNGVAARMKAFLGRIPAGLSEESRDQVVKAYVNDKVDMTYAIQEAFEIGRAQARDKMKGVM